MEKFSIAVVGATGLVGNTLLALLENRKFPIDKLFLLASQQSTGKCIRYGNHDYPVHDLATFDFTKTQLAFFCVGNDLAAHYAPIAAKSGNIVIDKSHYFRNHRDVPLIIPEVNLPILNHYHKINIISNPNCNTIPIAVAINDIYHQCGIKRMNIATYQSVSGAGKEGMMELEEQSRRLLAGDDVEPKLYDQQMAFNVLPHIDEFQENGYTREEMKMVWEIQKLFNDRMIAINPTAVRVPVFYGHAAAVHLETIDKLSEREAISLLSKTPGVKLITGDLPYPTPAHNAAGQDYVYVGRVREDISHDRGLNLWVVTDNLRKGAALNAVQIAEYLIKDHL